ncbi:baseplate J/gp47 family protein [Brevibacterium sp. JNUCC-42]|nr:baseplate J/gp47 family protein [Brevibacterium sp. JNUCC-42]
MLTEKGFKRRRFVDIFHDMETKGKESLGEKINLSDKSPLGIIFRLFAWGLSLLWQQVERVYYSRFIDTTDGKSMDYVAKNIGISRATSRKSFGQLTITGDDTTIIQQGFRFSTKTGVLFESQQEAVITSGQAVVKIQAVEAGSSGNVPAGAVNTVVNPIPGVSSVTNPNKIENGRDRETDHEFRKRYDQSISKGGSSTTASIIAGILNVPGVRDCIVEENDTMEYRNGVPPKSLGPVVFGGDDKDIAEIIKATKAGGIRSWGEKEIAVQDSLGTEHMIGFTRPKVVDIYVKVTVVINSHFPIDGYTQVRTAIVKHIGGRDEDDTLYSGLRLEEPVVHSQMISAVYEVKGITDVTLAIGTEPEKLRSDNISISSKQVAESDWQKVVVD